MKKPHPDSEDALELRTIELFKEIEWKKTANCYHEWQDDKSTLGRSSRKEVVLVPQLRKALTRLNPDLSATAIDLESSNKFLPLLLNSFFLVLDFHKSTSTGRKLLHLNFD